MFGPMKPNDPAGISEPIVSSNLSPVPRWKVPEITVTFSVVGCQ